MKQIFKEKVEVSPENGPFLGIGFGFYVNVDRVTSIMPYVGVTMARLYKDRRDAGRYYDATRGRAKQSILVLDNGDIIGSAFKPETIMSRQF